MKSLNSSRKTSCTEFEGHLPIENCSQRQMLQNRSVPKSSIYIMFFVPTSLRLLLSCNLLLLLREKRYQKLFGGRVWYKSPILGTMRLFKKFQMRRFSSMFVYLQARVPQIHYNILAKHVFFKYFPK